MKVLMLTTSYPRYRGDYAGSFIHEMAKELVSQGVSVSVLAPEDEAAKGLDNWDGVEVKRIRYFWPGRFQKLCYGGGIFQNLRTNLIAWLQLPFLAVSFFWNGVLMSKKADVVHGHWMLCGSIAVLIKVFRKKSAVITVHGSDLNLICSKGVLAKIYGSTLTSADCVITVSNRLKELVLGLSPKAKVTVIHNCVDPAMFGAKTKKVSGKTKTILFVGRLCEAKGIRHLIEAFSEASQDQAGVKLTIVGDGPMRGELSAEIEQRGMKDWIEIRGFIDYQDLPSVYSESDIFVLPSLSEGFPLTVVEAMASKVAVIATDVGGIPEILVDGVNGLLVKPGSSQGLSDAMKRLIMDEQLRDRLAEAGRQTILSSYTLGEAAKETVAVYLLAYGLEYPRS
jgi:L-malate glycosyltransferase